MRRKETVNSSMQVWPAIDAPGWLLELLGRGMRYDWVAFVPQDLNDDEVIGFLIRDGGKRPTELVNLADGSALLAGQFEEHAGPVASRFERRPMSREKVRMALFG